MTTHDVVLIGAGPAHLALLIHLERALGPAFAARCRLIEARSCFNWHADMAVSDARLQTSFLKDLVTLRDPTSPYTFLNYLKEVGLLDRFVHLNTCHPSRDLYRRYLDWVAKRFDAVISYNTFAETIVATPGGYNLTVIDGQTRTSMVARHALSLALGSEPSFPGVLPKGDPRIFHTSQFLEALAGLENPGCGRHFLVIGAGQSAGEVVRHLLGESPDNVVHVASRGHLFQQVDDNPFVNDMYSEEGERAFFALPALARIDRLMASKTSNFGVVDRDVLEDLYRLDFDDRVRGYRRLHLHGRRTLVKVDASGAKLFVVLASSEAGAPAQYLGGLDAIIAATGYQDNRAMRMLQNVLTSPPPVTLETDQDFRLRHASGPGIYLMNHDRLAHGPTEGTMTGLAGKAARIADSVLATLTATSRDQGALSAVSV